MSADHESMELSDYLTDDFACCVHWRDMLEAISIIPDSPEDLKCATVLAAMLRWQLGNFCPTCGSKL